MEGVRSEFPAFLPRWKVEYREVSVGSCGRVDFSGRDRPDRGATIGGKTIDRTTQDLMVAHLSHASDRLALDRNSRRILKNKACVDARA